MDASILKQRIIVKRLTKTADGYGGWTSTKATVGTYWCQAKEVSGDISAKNGIRLKETEVELTLRKETAFLIQFEDVLQIEGSNVEYRLNSAFQLVENFWSKAKITAIANEN